MKKIKSCNCFYELLKKYEPFNEKNGDGDKLRIMISKDHKFSISIDSYFDGRLFDKPFDLVNGATYCPYCGKKIEVEE